MPESAEWIRLHGIEEKETDDMTRKTEVKPVKLGRGDNERFSELEGMF
jgi:hypothetical protein